MNNYTYTSTCRNILNTIRTSGHSSLEKYTSHFIERVVYERELETEQRLQHIDPQTLRAIIAFLSHSPELLNRGPWGPISLLRAGSHSSNWSTDFKLRTSTDLNFLSPGLYHCFTPTQFNLTTIKVILWSPDVFDRMHLLFTLVHFFFWQLGRVGVQYATVLGDPVAKGLKYWISWHVANALELLKCYYIHIQTNTLKKVSNPLNLPCIG